MNVVQYHNKENFKYLHKVIKTNKKGFNLRRRKVKLKVEDKIISLIIIELLKIKIMRNY